MINNTKTAILLFAQSAQSDATCKPQLDRTVLDVLNVRVLRTVQQTGLDFFHFTEREQRGSSFGSRFTNAISDVFAMGYASVICLGNDTPLLNAQLISQATQLLQQGHVVTGKSLDGGFYLMAMNRSQFHPASFESLPWQTASLASAFSAYTAALRCSTTQLQALKDIDSMADLRQFVAGKDTRLSWIRLLVISLSRKRTTYTHTAKKIIQGFYTQPANKGSPQLLVA